MNLHETKEKVSGERKYYFKEKNFRQKRFLDFQKNLQKFTPVKHLLFINC